jgi:hypothetical protein
MKAPNNRSKDSVRIEVFMKVLSLANTFTGARFETPPTKSQAEVLNECAVIILRDYLSLSVEELYLAFSLAAGGKFEGINIETYYGEFTPHILGKILKAYSAHQKKVLGAYNENVKLLSYQEEKHTQEEKERLNQEAKKDIINEYNAVKKIFNEESSAFNQEMVKGSWARLLVQEGIINFSLEQKQETLKEAKTLCINRLKGKITQKGVGFSQLQSIKHTLKRIANNQQDNDFQAKVTAEYSRLLIIKSFIQ